MSQVYFSKTINEKNIKKILDPFLKDINPHEKIILKTHFGEKGNTRFVSPDHIKIIANTITQKTKNKNNIFLCDCNTLYKGMRSTATNHIKIAEEHGFKKTAIPIVIADGELGEEEYEVEINKKHFQTAYIGKFYEDADILIIISHFKGHLMTGYGGAIKNIGMGMASRRGKLAMHSKINPSVTKSKCISCKKCIENCEVNAIILNQNNKAEIIQKKCIGCAKCINICSNKAINVPWQGASSDELIERTAEYAFAATKGKKIICINFLNNITQDCDCLADSKIISEDIGIITSNDPVSLDKSNHDLVIKHNKKDVFKEVNQINANHIIEYSEKIGLGNKEYNLEEI